jgi:hypothetical protein
LINNIYGDSDNEGGLPYSTEVVPQLFQALVCWFPDSPLLVQMVVAQDMWWWLHRICDCGGRVLEETKLRLTQLSLVELGLGLSLAIYCILLEKTKGLPWKSVSPRLKIGLNFETTSRNIFTYKM